MNAVRTRVVAELQGRILRPSRGDEWVGWSDHTSDAMLEMHVYMMCLIDSAIETAQ